MIDDIVLFWLLKLGFLNMWMIDFDMKINVFVRIDKKKNDKMFYVRMWIGEEKKLNLNEL